jgi:NTE family protein
MAEEQNQVVGSGDTKPQQVEDDRGWALCLSGGGFRATLFHLGSILRLNELGVLAKLSTITSVSGGSILNGVLATRWSRLNFDPATGRYTNIEQEIARPIRDFCSRDLRTKVLLGTRLNPANLGVLIRDWFSVSANFLAEGYEPLFNGCRLSAIPEPQPQVPRFVFCSTNVRTGACWHFHGGPRARMGDYYVGYCDACCVRVSDAVAASSAFPPGFSAFRLKMPPAEKITRIDPWGEERSISAKRGDERHGPSARPVLLTDGGVYDNLGVEPVWTKYKTLLVSDAGRPFESVPESGQAILTRLKRVVDISMEQVAAVRKRWLVADFLAKKRTGAIWTLHTLLEDFQLNDACGYGTAVRKLLHRVRTDLDAFTEGEVACLENHGYSLADAALRSRARALCPNAAAQFQWPHQVWSDDRRLQEALADSARMKIRRDVWRYCTGRLP